MLMFLMQAKGMSGWLTTSIILLGILARVGLGCAGYSYYTRALQKEVLSGLSFLTVMSERGICDGISGDGSTSNNREVVDETYDIAIVGGGMVGLAFACGLSRKGNAVPTPQSTVQQSNNNKDVE